MQKHSTNKSTQVQNLKAHQLINISKFLVLKKEYPVIYKTKRKIRGKNKHNFMQQNLFSVNYLVTPQIYLLTPWVSSPRLGTSRLNHKFLLWLGRKNGFLPIIGSFTASVTYKGNQRGGATWQHQHHSVFSFPFTLHTLHCCLWKPSYVLSLVCSNMLI